MRKARPLPLFDRLKTQTPVAGPRRLCVPTILLTAGIASLALTIALPPAPRLIWNASASAPIGLYAVAPHARVERGDLVFAWAPPAARDLAARRRYLPQNVPLLKQVAAARGDRICARRLTITVNGKPAVTRRSTDRMGRPLLAWQGCFRLEDGQLFLLMTKSPDSFDGRYFGATETRDVIGKASSLWLP